MLKTISLLYIEDWFKSSLSNVYTLDELDIPENDSDILSILNIIPNKYSAKNINKPFLIYSNTDDNLHLVINHSVLKDEYIGLFKININTLNTMILNDIKYSINKFGV